VFAHPRKPAHSPRVGGSGWRDAYNVELLLHGLWRLVELLAIYRSPTACLKLRIPGRRSLLDLSSS
jgi:hypothetical protein